MKASQLPSFAGFAVAVLVNIPAASAQPPVTTVAPALGPVPAPAANAAPAKAAPANKLPAKVVRKAGKPDVDASPQAWLPLKVRYVKPSYLAFWLDPVNQAEPADFVQSRKIQELAGHQLVPARKEKEADFNRSVSELPKGVGALVPIDDEKVLLALATPEGAKNLQKIMSFLDKPIRMVAVEANLIEMSDAEIEELGVQFPKDTPEKQPKLGYVRGDREDEVEKLLREGRARILASYQFSTKNNLANGDTALLSMGAKADGTPPLNDTVCSLAVTPTANNDDSITMIINMAASLWSPAGKDTIPGKEWPSFGFRSIANVASGKTILLGGLAFGDTPTMAEGVEPEPAPAAQKNVFLLIKARILEGGRVL